MTCFVCDKHKKLGDLLLAESPYTYVSHFPIENSSLPVLGYFLIEPKRHITSMADLSAAEAEDLGKFTVKLTALLEREMRAEQVYLFKIGDLVKHVHFHVLPRFADTPKDFWGLAGRDWPGAKRGNQADIVQLLQRLRPAFAK
jgi:histidine triad (HIT) family protein